MTNELIAAAVVAWLIASIVALTERGLILVRLLLFAGCVAAICGAIMGLPDGSPVADLPTTLAGAPVRFLLTPAALWLLGFGAAPAALACALAPPSSRNQAAGCSAPP